MPWMTLMASLRDWQFLEGEGGKIWVMGVDQN